METTEIKRDIMIYDDRLMKTIKFMFFIPLVKIFIKKKFHV